MSEEGRELFIYDFDAAHGAGWSHYGGSAQRVLPLLPADHFEAMVCDPPAAIAFMGQKWDGDAGGRAQWVAAMAAIFREALRVLKPGGHALVWALPRTAHWTATALEDAGFELRDCVYHLFGQGFPKSLTVSDHLDGEPSREWAGFGTALKPAVECWFLARKPLGEGTVAANVLRWGVGALNLDACRVAAPGGSPAAARRESARRTGNSPSRPGEYNRPLQDRTSPERYMEARASEQLGRHPAHLVLSHTSDCRRVGEARVKGSRTPACAYQGEPGYRGGLSGDRPARGIGDTDGRETVETWQCAAGCPIAELGAQSGQLRTDYARRGNQRVSHFGGKGKPQPDLGYGDTGTAARFYTNLPAEPEPDEPDDDPGDPVYTPFCYASKASTSERERGLRGHLPCAHCGQLDSTHHPNPRGTGKPVKCRRNLHPTVKGQALMAWLISLVSRPSDTVLDPFCGSGSTGVAALLIGRKFVGIDSTAEYWPIARRRLEHAAEQSVVGTSNVA
jgi:hypothetical protein